MTKKELVEAINDYPDDMKIIFQENPYFQSGYFEIYVFNTGNEYCGYSENFLLIKYKNL